MFVDTLLASFLPVGSRTALYYADRINQLPMGTLGVALGTVLLPEMSSRLALGDRAGSDTAQNRSAAMSLLLTLPFVAAYFAVPGTIMRADVRRMARVRSGRGGAGGRRCWPPMAWDCRPWRWCGCWRLPSMRATTR